MKINCPVCGKLSNYENNRWKPFCSNSCKIIDLWNWVHEYYSIKVEEVDEKIIAEGKNDKTDRVWCSRKNGQ